MRRLLSLSACVAMLLSACASAPVEPLLPPDSSSAAASGSPTASAAVRPGRDIALRSPDGTVVTVRAEDARTREEQEKGLMWRDSLADDAGMLFTFDTEQTLRFWMKNTLIPLDIIYFDAQKRFVSALTMTPCAADPCATYSSRLSALYALEVPAGSVAKWGVGDGWMLIQD